MHALIGQYDETQDRFIVVHEIHQPRMDVRGMVRYFGQIFNKAGGLEQFPEVLVYGDATGRSGWAGTGETCYTILFEELQQMGLGEHYKKHVPPNNPPVVDAVNAVQAALLDAKADTHVLIHPRCKILLRDLEQVKWDKNGKELDKANHALSHMSDAFRYWVHRKRPLRLRRGPTVGGRVSVGGR